MESASDICSDIIFEVLSRLPLQSLGKFRLLSKECNSLTYESTFMNLHCQRTNTISGYFLQYMLHNKYSSSFASIDNPSSRVKPSLDFLPGNVKIEASTKQGILLCVDQRISRYYVCKPSTKEWQRIPNPKTRYATEKTALMVLKSNPLHYKIIRFSKPKFHLKFKQYRCLRCEIFDSKTRMWNQLEEVKLPYGEFLVSGPVSACGSLHWLTYSQNIFAFHVCKESYSMFSLPQPAYESDYSEHMKLIEYGGKLALICIQVENFVELWVMENYGNNVWNKKQTISIEALRREEPYTSPVAFYNADIALMNWGIYKAVFFNFKNGSAEIVRLEKVVADEIFPFQSDFECSNLMGKFEQQHSRIKPKPKSSLLDGDYINIGQLSLGRGCYFAFSPIILFLALLLAFIFLN